MDKITLLIGSKEYSWAIDSVKYFWGNNYSIKHSIRQRLKQFFENVSMSEFQATNNLKLNFELNDEGVSHRDWEYYEVTPYFTLTTDLKLNAKSLILKYLDSIFEDTLCFDEITTISELMKSISMQINDSIDFNQDIKLNLRSDDFTIKSLIKYISAFLISDDLEVIEPDLSFNEIMLLQLNMILRIVDSERGKIKNHLVVLDTPILSNKLADLLTNITNSNLKIIVFNNSYHNPIEISDYVIINNGFIDLFFEEVVVDKIIYELGINSTIDEIREQISNIIADRSDEKSSSILKII